MHYSGASGVERGGSQSGQQHSDGTKTFPAASIGIDHRNYNMTSDLNILLLHQNNRTFCFVLLFGFVLFSLFSLVLLFFG